MKAGMLKLSICKTAIQDLVERSAFSFKEFAVQQGFEFNIDIDYNTDIYIDVEKMESVIKICCPMPLNTHQPEEKYP